MTLRRVSAGRVSSGVRRASDRAVIAWIPRFLGDPTPSVRREAGPGATSIRTPRGARRRPSAAGCQFRHDATPRFRSRRSLRSSPAARCDLVRLPGSRGGSRRACPGGSRRRRGLGVRVHRAGSAAVPLGCHARRRRAHHERERDRDADRVVRVRARVARAPAAVAPHGVVRRAIYVAVVVALPACRKCGMSALADLARLLQLTR
jgi:hypothetical protein